MGVAKTSEDVVKEGRGRDLEIVRPGDRRSDRLRPQGLDDEVRQLKKPKFDEDWF
jgi:hypothetical protein